MISIIVAAALAATPIRLEEVRQQSRGNTRALQAELDRRRAVEQVKQARAPLLPQVNLGFQASGGISGPRRAYVPVPVQDPDTGAISFTQQQGVTPTFVSANFDLNVGVTQLLYDAGRWALLAQAGAQEESFQGQAYEEQLTSELEGVRRFYLLYRAQRTQQVLDARVTDDQSLVERAAALYQAGKRRKEDSISAQVNLGNDRIAGILQRSQTVGAQADLAIWILRPGTEELEAVDPGTLSAQPASLPSAEDALRLARENRPLIKAYQAQVRAAEQGIAAANSGYLPRVSASVTVDRSAATPDPFFTDPLKQNSVNGSLNLSWNLFSGFTTRSQVQDAGLAREKQQLQLDQSLRDLDAEVLKALSTLRWQIEATEVARVNRELAHQGLELATERFGAGAATTLEIRDAQLKVTNSELVWLNSRIDVEVARAALERSMGVLSRGVSQ